MGNSIHYFSTYIIHWLYKILVTLANGNVYDISQNAARIIILSFSYDSSHAHKNIVYIKYVDLVRYYKQITSTKINC